MRPVEYAEGQYVAQEQAKADDLYFPFAELMWKRATWQEVCHWLTSINDDVHNLATALAKIDFFWDMRERRPVLSVGRFVKNEIEYILMVCRSILDSLHEITAAIWEKVTLTDPEAQKRKRPLEKKFSSMVFRENKLMSAEEIAKHRHVPPGLAALYAEAGPFLGTVRQLRDRVVHGGHDAPFVFCTPRGFAIDRAAPHFAALPVWAPEHTYNENLVSLRPLLAHLILTTLYLCNGFGDALSRFIVLPDDIAPGYQVFLRSTHGAAMTRTQAVLRGGPAWWADDPPAVSAAP
jgi:hypothetical protein